MNDLFTYRDPFPREELEAYARGSLPPGQEHDVELLLEASPLHHEAVEGLRAVAGAAFTALDRHRPGRGGGTTWLLAGGALVIAAVLLWRSVGTSPMRRPPTFVVQEVASVPSVAPATMMTAEELAAGRELPESLQIGHEPRSERPPAMVIERDDDPGPTAERLPPRSIRLPGSTTEPREQRPKAAPRASRHLVFLHDLKVVHPDELYPERQPMFFQTGVPANQNTEAKGIPVAGTTEVSEQQTRDTAAWNKLLRDSAPKISYLDYMDHALGAFARGEHATSLEELRYLLTLFPDDVNALFYCGLSAYNMDLTSKAAAWFQRVRDHSVDSFSEEADWYRALCIEKLHGAAAAAPEFKRIAAQGGFYAAKAKEQLLR